jgi:hypothetical protein
MSQPKQPSNLYYSPATYITAQQLTSQPSNLCYSPATYATAQQLMSQPINLCLRQSLSKAEFGKGRVWQR